jgi:hypothetical protein
MNSIMRLAVGNTIFDGMQSPSFCRINAKNVLMPERNVFGSLAQGEALFKRHVRVEWMCLSAEEAADILDIITSAHFSIILGAAQGGTACGDYVCEDYLCDLERVKDSRAEYSLSFSAREI